MTEERAQVGYSWDARKVWLDLPFPSEEYQARVGKIRERMRDMHLDAVLILGDQNELGYLRYVSNFEPLFSCPQKGALYWLLIRSFTMSPCTHMSG
jgi:hypothetical protein